MKTTSRKTLSAFLALALVLALFAAMPITASAAATAEEMAADIINFYHGGSGSLTAVPSGNTVTVTGNVTGATSPLTLNTSNLSIIWQANYSGNAGSEALITLTGEGVFTVASGGSITNNGDNHTIEAEYNNVTINVSGGNVKSIGRGYAIACGKGAQTINISGGSVSSDDDVAAICCYESTAITINVSGGSVYTTNNNVLEAIEARNCTVNVSGGSIYSKNDVVIGLYGSSTTVTVNGGFLFCQGPNAFYLDTAPTPTVGGSAVVCAWDMPSGAPAYNEGTSTDLTVVPAGASVVWGRSGGQSGVSYLNGANTGFFPVSGVTVNAAPASAAPQITGPVSMTLTTGYAATSTDAFTITGTPAPTVTKSGSSAIMWNNSSKKLEIGAGLAKGTYEVVLTASNGVNPEAKFTFTLTVTDGSSTGAMSNFTKTRTYTPGMFSDVIESQWYGYNNERAVANAYEYSLMSGDPGGTFRPSGNMTLAEAITIAARVHHIYNGGNGEFVQGSVWYQVYVDYAIANGIITSTDFADYSRAATRSQMAYIF